MKIRKQMGMLVVALVCGLGFVAPVGAADAPAARDLDDVLVYPTMEDGSIMHWLCISPLRYDVAFLGDSMSADVLEAGGRNELTVRPRAGEAVQRQRWQKMHFNGAVQGPSMCELIAVSGGYFEYGLTYCCAYVYSPVDHPNAVAAASADDALKMIVNGKKIWSNQIQRSPTYDSDQVAAPLKKGWNTVLMVVDQVSGGHLLCARFIEGDKPVTDLEIALDPPADNATRHPAAAYNKEAADLMRHVDEFKGAGKWAEAIGACDQVLSKYPLADVAPRAAYMKAQVYYSTGGEKSLGQPDQSIEALEALLARYPQDLLAEYALLDVGQLREQALKDLVQAEATYRSFEDRYPQSTLAARSVVALARMLAEGRKFEDALLTYRKAIKKYPNSDEVMTATVGIADTYRLAGDKDKAKQQYQAAVAMAKDWHDNKYGVDVGKQAWLREVMESIRGHLGTP